MCLGGLSPREFYYRIRLLMSSTWAINGDDSSDNSGFKDEGLE